MHNCVALIAYERFAFVCRRGFRDVIFGVACGWLFGSVGFIL